MQLWAHRRVLCVAGNAYGRYWTVLKNDIAVPNLSAITGKDLFRSFHLTSVLILYFIPT